MAISPISPAAADLRLTQLLNDDPFSSGSKIDQVSQNQEVKSPFMSREENAFEMILSKAVESLNSVSQAEKQANDLITKFTKGEADISQVMIAQSKAGIQVQFAVTTVNAVVNTLKEVTQLQI
ncbi:MAG: flagellar hook-basal body complex protein FliE [Candidatus Margulisiibacteriota bacterium]